ncbi:lysine-N-methylase [Cohnella abietis]|uniref:Lysine-N-methylase n=1 Tax=Cohnella abietis TaxID=2507935 RepID=A0A3T1DDA5_9BACL|nr:lysine-N-methylase [Cohnella abietis]
MEKDIYQLYKSLPDKSFSEKIISSMDIIESGGNENIYASIKLSDSGSCPMLTETDLCSIHAKIGEDYLPAVCSTFPRIFNEVDGVQELSTDLACPEAVRKALFNEQGIQFYEKEAVENRMTFQSIKPSAAHENQFEAYFWPLRFFIIQTLQNRAFSFENRLIMLGLFFENLNFIVEQNEFHKIPILIESCKIEFGKHEQIEDQLKGIQGNWIVKLDLFNEFVKEKSTSGIALKAYLECLNQVMEGVGFTANATPDKVMERLKTASDEIVVPFMSTYDYIFENLAVHNVYSKLFPLSGKHKLMEEYFLLVFQYSIINIQLAGLGAYHGKLTEELCVKLIYSYIRNNDRNKNFIQQMLKLLKDKGLNNVSALAPLIKR